MSGPGRRPMERRRFVRTALGGSLGAALAGCASVVAVPVRVREGHVRLPLADHPGLRRPGGFLKLRTRSAGRTLYVLTLETGGYAALSPVCTHQGCTVDVQSRHLVCPCHGSTYTREGEVVRGPAPLPLRRFPLRVEAEDVLVIDTESS